MYEKNLKKISLVVLTFLAYATACVINSILPDKYFFDANRVNSMVLKDGRMAAWDGSYVIAADFFRAINVLDLTTIMEWSIVLGLIGTIVVVFFLFDSMELSLLEELFWLMSIVLLNIYTLNICKDFIQFFFYVVILLVVMFAAFPTPLRLVLICAVLIIEGLGFRSYYMLVAVFFLMLYVIVTRFNCKSFGKVMLWSVLGCVVFVIAAYVILPAQYAELATARTGVNDSREFDANANSMINNAIPGTSLGATIVNFPINVVRLLFPVEMMIRGPLYLMFFVYQLILDYLLYRSAKQLLSNRPVNRVGAMLIALYLAFVITCSFFEPDFGSWLRHEVTAFPVYQALFFSRQAQSLAATQPMRSLRGVAVQPLAI
ncbi:hypothetical protein ACLUVW_01135 [Bifidobacterium pseudolongum subsp. globosum]|uniref:hypothetical protein n=1 Tax=Bifidobacterium pseudolongum TaxID=1694 RepID=UPI003993979B